MSPPSLQQSVYAGAGIRNFVAVCRFAAKWFPNIFDRLDFFIKLIHVWVPEVWKFITLSAEKSQTFRDKNQVWQDSPKSIPSNFISAIFINGPLNPSPTPSVGDSAVSRMTCRWNVSSTKRSMQSPTVQDGHKLPLSLKERGPLTIKLILRRSQEAFRYGDGLYGKAYFWFTTHHQSRLYRPKHFGNEEWSLEWRQR